MQHLMRTRRSMPLGADQQPRRPFRDWLADAERQCERRTGSRYASNAAPDRYWLAAYQCGLTAWEAADTFIQENRN